MVLAFVSAHPQQAFGSFRNVATVAPLSSTLVPTPPTAQALQLRPYQVDCIERGRDSNCIVCLDTGLGKVRASTTYGAPLPL